MESRPAAKAGGAAAKLSKLRAQQRAAQTAQQPKGVLVAANKDGRAAGAQRVAESSRGQDEESLRRMLAEKDEVIKSLRSRLSIAQQQAQRSVAVVAEQPAAVVLADRQCGGVDRRLEAQNAQLEGANVQLRQRLQETLLELQAAHDQLRILQQLQQELETCVPGAPALVEAALAQERTLQEARNERVLQMLKSKDEVIQSFESRYAEAQSEAGSFRAQLEVALQQLDNSQLRVCELVEAHSKLRHRVEVQEVAAAQAAAAAKAKIAQLQEEVSVLRQRDGERCLLHDRIMAQQSDLAAAHSEVEKLSEAVEAANVVIQELQSAVQEREEQLGQREQALRQHQEHVARLLGVPLVDAPSLIAAAVPAQQPPFDFAQRIAELEAANERLEEALVAANARGAGSPTAGDEDEDAVTQLSIQLAERQGQLEMARRQVQELEALQHLARETALQTEGKLMESVRQAAACQQRCDEMQQRTEEAEGVASQLNARVSELALAEQASRAELHSAQEALERLQQERSEVDRLRAEEGQAHARDVEHLEAQLADAKSELAACQASRAELEKQAEALQQQVEALQQAHSRLGSSLGHSTYASSMLAANGAARPMPLDMPLAALEDAAALPHDKLLQLVSALPHDKLLQLVSALPHDKLLQLVSALQLDVKALQVQLEGTRSEAAAAQQRALAAERAVQSGSYNRTTSLLEDVASAAAAASEGGARAAQLGQQHAEEMLWAAQAEAAKAEADLTSRCKALQQQLDAAEAECARAASERGAAQVAAAAAEQAAEERKAQLAVVMQTLEVLQSGPPDAQREHVLAMMGELAAARHREAGHRQRVAVLEGELGAARELALTSQQRLAAALETGKTAQQSQAEAEAAVKVYRGNAEDMRTKLLEQQELATKAQAELFEARQAAAASKAAVAGLQTALRQAQERHLEQLARERADAATAARGAHLSRLRSGPQPPTPEPHAALLAPLQECLAQLKAAAAADKEELVVEASAAVNMHLQELLLRVQRAETEGQAMEAELHAVREQCRSAGAALEARTSEWQAALAEKEALQHQLAQADVLAAAAQQRLELERSVALSDQLSQCRVQLARMEAALQQAEAERSKYKAEASELLAKLVGAEASLACPPGLPAPSSSPAVADGAGEQPVADMLTAAHRRADILAEQNAGLKSTLLELQTRLGSLATSIQAPAPSQHISELERQLKQAQQQLSALQEQLQQREAQARAQRAEVERLEVTAALLEAQLVEAQRRAAAAEQHAREELAGSNIQECEALARQAVQVKEQAKQAAREAQQKVLQDAQAAQGRVEELEAQLLAEGRERDALHSTVAQLEAQLAETCATLDAKAAALSLVQGGRLEFGGSPSAVPCTSPGAKQRGGASVATLSQHLLEANLAEVEATKQLRVAEKLNKSLKKQLAHAEHRAGQLREALRAKAAAHKALVEQTQLLLTQRLGPAGVSTDSSSAGLPALFSELSAEWSVQAAEASGAALGSSPAAPALEGLPPAAALLPGAPYLQMELANREVEVERLQAALDKAIDAQRRQAECFASLTAQALQKEQELRDRLATLEQVSAELALLRGRCFAAVHDMQQALLEASSGGAGAPAGPGAEGPVDPNHLPELCKELLSQFRDQRQVIERLQQYASTAASQAADRARVAEVEALPPLECSQRAVIRSLTVQLADLRRQLAQLCSERDQLRERLRALRGSLGSGRAAEVQESIDLQSAAAGPAFDMPYDARPSSSGGSGRAASQLPLSPAEARADHAEGLFILLRHHVRTLARAEQQLAALQQQQQQQPLHGDGDLERSLAPEVSPGPGGSFLLPQLAHAAGVLAAELPAMQATIQVLQAEVMWLLASQGGAEGEWAGTSAGASQAGLPALCLPTTHDAALTDAAAAQDSLGPGEVEGKLLKAKQRKDKWKQRCLEAEAQLQATQAAAAGAEAAVHERMASLEQAHEELMTQQSAVAAQLKAAEAAAAYAEADKAQLELALQSCTRELGEAAAVAESLHREVQAQRQQQGETERLQQELEGAQAMLEHERQEHAQLVASLRAMIAELQSSGGAETELRTQLIQLAEKVAVLTAAQGAARLEVEQKESAQVEQQQELEALRAAYAALEAERQGADEALAGTRQEYRALWQLLEAAETRLHQVESTLLVRCEALRAQLEQISRQRDPPGIASLAAGLGGLQAAAEDLQDRYERLEAQAAVLIQQKHAAAVAQWARLTRSQRYRSAVQVLRDGLQHDLLEAQALCQAQAVQLAQLQGLAEASQQDYDELVARLEEAKAEHRGELQALTQRHADEVAAMEQDWAAARLDLQRQAELMARAAAAAAEQRAKAELAGRVSQAEERALVDITNAQSQRGQLAQELAAARAEFKRYQALKAVEVKLLEQRVLHLMRGGGGGSVGGSSKGKQQQQQVAIAAAGGATRAPAHEAAALGLLPQQQAAAGLDGDGGLAITAVSEIVAVCSSDGIAAALREANLERLQREQMEREAAGAREAAEAMRGRLKAVEGELAGLKGRLGVEVRATRERAERLQSELTECQQALRQAKAESGRRLKELQALQKQASAAEDGGGAAAAGAALEQERRAREAAEAQLREARQALARKAAMVKELRSKVCKLEQELVMSGSAPLQVELEACQARLKALQASCASKESTIRELRQRLEEHVRLAAEQGAQEERQRGKEAVQMLKAELAKREAQVGSLREELGQVQKGLDAATASMQTAEAERQATLESTGRQLVRSMQHAQQLSQAVQELLALVGALAGAAAAGAAACSAHAAARGGPAGARVGFAASAVGLAQQLSSFVDLPAEDIESLLLPTGGGGAGAGDSQADREGPGEQLPLLVQEAGGLVERLHSAYDAGMPADNAMLASLATLLAILKQQCLRARDALDNAVAQLPGQAPLAFGEQEPTSTGPGDAVHYLEEQLRRAAREIGEIEERLL